MESANNYRTNNTSKPIEPMAKGAGGGVDAMWGMCEKE
jgi:hypothetical protein